MPPNSTQIAHITKIPGWDFMQIKQLDRITADFRETHVSILYDVMLIYSNNPLPLTPWCGCFITLRDCFSFPIQNQARPYGIQTMILSFHPFFSPFIFFFFVNLCLKILYLQVPVNLFLWFMRTQNCKMAWVWPRCTTIRWFTRTYLVSSLFQTVKSYLKGTFHFKMCNRFTKRVVFSVCVHVCVSSGRVHDKVTMCVGSVFVCVRSWTSLQLPAMEVWQTNTYHMSSVQSLSL